MGLWWGNRGLLPSSTLPLEKPQTPSALRTGRWALPLGSTNGRNRSPAPTERNQPLSPKSKRTRPMADCSWLLRDIEGEGDRWGGLTYFLWRSSTLRNIPTYIQHFLTKTKHFHKENWTFRYWILTILSVLQRNTPTSSLPLWRNAHSGHWTDAPAQGLHAAQGRWVGTWQLRRVLGRGHPRAQAQGCYFPRRGAQGPCAPSGHKRKQGQLTRSLGSPEPTEAVCKMSRILEFLMLPVIKIFIFGLIFL